MFSHPPILFSRASNTLLFLGADWDALDRVDVVVYWCGRAIVHAVTVGMSFDLDGVVRKFDIFPDDDSSLTVIRQVDPFPL